MADYSADVLVLGAGAAGLAAAARLTGGGMSVAVIDARDRIGGRCHTRHETEVPVPVELGAEFIHGRSPATLELLAQAGIPALDSAGPHWFARDGQVEARQNFFPEIRRAMRARKPLKSRDVTFAEFLAQDLRGQVSAGALAFARSLVEGFNAADPARISAREIAAEWAGDGAPDGSLFRPLGGYGALLASLAGSLARGRVSMRLNSIARDVRWKRGRVDVTGTCSGMPFRASAPRAIVTLPLGVLKLPRASPHAVRFAPALAEKRGALKMLDPGCAVKVALQFRTPFWEKLERGRYRDAAFFHLAGAAVPTFWTSLPLRTALLTAWAGGPRAHRLYASGEAATVRRCLESLESIFGTRAGVKAQFAGAWVHDWERDPYCRGAYSYVTAGGQGARENLARPLRNTLYFAGEAADVSGEAGTVGGALQSGMRAAREVIEHRKR